jgi:predicted DNA-binding protein (MmcQ/YjbR family)
MTLTGDELPGRLGHPELDLHSDPRSDPTMFKVRGKVFMLMTEVPGRPVVILKADPAEAQALREQYETITPGYHMNKKHWITVAGGDEIGERLVGELVTESYRLVVGGLPTSQQPVDPHPYGRR